MSDCKARYRSPLFWQEFIKLPKVDIKRFDLIDARLQGNNWAFNDLDLTVTDLTLEKGDWQSTDGQLSLNATDLIDGNLHFNDPNINLDLTPQGINIRQFSTRWEGGLLRTRATGSVPATI